MNRQLYERANYVIKCVRELGIKLHNESRPMRMHKALVGPDGKGKDIARDHPDLQTGLEAIRDLTILEYIFDNIKFKSNPQFIDSIRRMMKDSVLPQYDRDRSVGRDTQAELYVAAICTKGEIANVRFEEPDIVCTIKDYTFGIAVKRLKNIRNFRKHVKKAADQIANAGYQGIIVLDMTSAFNPENKRIADKLPDIRFANLWRQNVNQFISHYEKDIHKWVHGKSVLGLIIQHHTVRYKTGIDEWSLETLTINMPLAGRNRHKTKMFNTFWKRDESALPDLTKLDKVGS